MILPPWSSAIAAIGVALVASLSPAAPQAGERLYQQCYSCHSVEPGENLPSGPTLYAIAGRPVAAEQDFDYSPALRAFAEKQPRWTPELLDKFIADPEALVPGTYMSFHGMPDEADRAALIDYLEGLEPAFEDERAAHAG